MEILLEPTSNKLMVGDLCDSMRIKLVTTGKKRWCDSIRIRLVPDTMAYVNVNAPAGQAPVMAPPMRTDDQILPHIRWVPIGKSNYYLDLDKSQSNPIYKIAWFDLTKETLRDALQFTPVNNNQAFTSPPSSDALINFINELGYPKLVRNLSNVITNDMFQPWRALTTIINLCLTGKTSGFERPRASVLQILWGVVTQTHIDYVERIWEEFTQSIYTFIDDKRNLAQHTSGKKKATLIVISSIRFTKLIIYHLQGKHKFHPRPDSPLHLPNEEPVLGYLKFRSDPDSPAPKPTKPARKPKSTTPKVPPRPSVSKPVTSAQRKPKSAPANTQGKKRKLATDIFDKPSKATKSRYGFVSKKCTPISTLKFMDESVAENVPAKEPQVDADMQRALEESLESMYDVLRGPLLPVVIRKPESKKYQPLLEVSGKGKAKRRTSTPTGSSGHNESSSLYAELGLSDGEEESQEAGPDPGAQDEGQARSNPDEQSEGQAGPDPDNAGADEQPMPNEGFTVTAYPNVQENLKLTVEEQVLLEEPASSSGTLSSLQHLSKDISFSDLFFSDEPSEADNDKATVETEVESMMSVKIQQDMPLIPPMTSPIIDLTSKPKSPKVHQQLKATAIETTTTTTTLPPPPYQQQSTVEAMMMKRIGELEHIMANLIQENKGLEERDLPEADMKEILHQRMWETESYKSHEDHMQLYEALEKSMNHDHSEELTKDLVEARKKKKKSRESFWILPSASTTTSTFIYQSRKSVQGLCCTKLLKAAALAEYQAWTTTDIRLRPSISLTPTDQQMDEDMAPNEQAESSDDKDIGSAHIPKVNLRQDWWKPLEEERPATPEPAWSISSSDVPVPTNNWASTMASNYSPPPEDSLLEQTGNIATFMDWFCKRRGITELKPQDLKGPTFEIVKVFHPDVIHLQYQMEECHKLLTDSVDSILRHNVSKPLPLGGPPGQVTIQSEFLFNKDLECLRYGSKGSRPALSISKMKAAYYPDVGLKQMVPYQFWIEEECKYDIAAIAVKTHMRILSVVRIKFFSMYGYDYMKKIVLHHADLNEHVISERDFKYMYPSDFEDMYLLNLQGHLNQLPPKYKKILTTAVNQWTRHLVIQKRVEDFQLGTESYQTQLNLTKPRWDATGFEYKHDYTVINSPMAVTFRDRYGVQMMMRFNEIYKKDVDKSKAFMFAIQKRLKPRRIFHNLESFIGGCVRDGDYRLLKRTE
nr:hypothetical protein [Tanacetum cinerariifolium]